MEVKLRVTQVPWPSTNINFMVYMCQFFCPHPNVWLGVPIYLKSSYIINLSLGISWTYELVCSFVPGYYSSSRLRGVAPNEVFINLIYITVVVHGLGY